MKIEDSPPVELTGLGVSAGIAIGTAYVVERSSIHVAEYRLKRGELAAEAARFAEAVEKSQGQLRRLQRKLVRSGGSGAEDLSYLLEAHVQMLKGSRLIRGVEARIRDHRLNAEAAVEAMINELATQYESVVDPYLAGRIADIREVGNRLIRNLTRTANVGFENLPRGTVLIAEELTPSDAALMDPRVIAGFITALGGPQDHTAIMARSLQIPAVLGVPDISHKVRTGDEVVLDGRSGEAVIRPASETRAAFMRRRDRFRREGRLLARLKDLPAETKDGVRVRLQVNVELPHEIDAVTESGAEGIGLLRTEFQFMNRDDLPGQEEQTAEISRMVAALDGRPLTIRTLDVGADKLASSLSGQLGHGENPALGLRAIRFGLTHKEILETQLSAILLAAGSVEAAGRDQVRILLPMITSADEVRAVRSTMARVARRLKRQGAALPSRLPALGVMIEVPAAALAADSLARVADFFSIGTNDLTQYTLAIDRGNEEVAHLYDPLNPAVLRLIQFTTEAAFRAQIPVAICGEMAGDPRFSALLMGLGLRELSMSASALPLVKQRIRKIDFSAAQRRAHLIMDQVEPARIADLIDDFNASL